jgi:hypothetical protein
MNVYASWMFLNFVSSMMMQCTLVNIVLLLIVSIFYAFYCTLDEFFSWMLDLWNHSDVLFQHWLEHLFDD